MRSCSTGSMSSRAGACGSTRRCRRPMTRWTSCSGPSIGVSIACWPGVACWTILAMGAPPTRGGTRRRCWPALPKPRCRDAGRSANGPVRRCGASAELLALAPSGHGPFHARGNGFDLHAAVVVPRRDRARLERLCRYALRPPIATDRLHPDRGRARDPRSAAPVGGQNNTTTLRAGGAARALGGADAAAADQPPAAVARPCGSGAPARRAELSVCESAAERRSPSRVRETW